MSELDKQRVVIIGTGLTGSIMVSELAAVKNFEVHCFDIDALRDEYRVSKFLKIDKMKTYFKNERTLGYGFGGTSNLWHGVLAEFDSFDWFKAQKSSPEFKNIQIELESNFRKCFKYFGDITAIKAFETRDILSAKEYCNLKKFEPKKYLIMKQPYRGRKKVRGLADKGDIFYHDNSLIVKLLLNSDKSQICKVEYEQNGVKKLFAADIFIVCAGAIETPRVLYQSAPFLFENEGKFKTHIFDHPQAQLGRVKLSRKRFFNLIGCNKLFSNLTSRIGFTLGENARKQFGDRSISIFLRPDMSTQSQATRQKSRQLLSSGGFMKMLLFLMKNPRIVTLAYAYLCEKLGFGFYTNTLAIWIQYEIKQGEESSLVISEKRDKFGRQVPKIVTGDGKISSIEYHILCDFLRDDFKGSDVELLDYNKIEVFSGAHHSGSFPIGTMEKDKLDTNLRVRKLDNLFVCDASILPFIGHVNLSLNLVLFACRLTQHLKSKYGKQ